MIRVFFICSDNTEFLVVVAIGKRNGFSNHRIFYDTTRLRNLDVTGWHINMVNIRQHALQRTTLGSQYKVNVFDIAIKLFANLVL